jgi:hypothetical protein
MPSFGRLICWLHNWLAKDKVSLSLANLLYGGFTRPAATKLQVPRELIARKKYRGVARINSKIIEFAGFLSGDCQSLLTSAATKIGMAGMGVSTN